MTHPHIIPFWIAGPIGDLWEKGDQLSSKECIGAHTQLLGSLVGAVDTDLHNLLGEARSVSPCFPQSLCTPALWGREPEDQAPSLLCPPGGRSTIWTVLCLGQPQSEPKITLCPCTGTCCAFLGSQETKSQGRSRVLLDHG